MAKYLVDTNVLIDHLRGNSQAKNFLLTSEVAISPVTVAELIQGTKTKKQLSGIEAVVNDLTIYSINENISSLGIDLMKNFFHSHHLFFLDSIIAATALAFKLTLVTSNTKHFRMIKNLKLAAWPIGN